MKAAVIIDHMTKNSLAVPTRKQLQAYGHNLVELYVTCVELSKSENRLITPVEDLPITSREILILLDGFAQSTRYHNLDSLSSSSNSKDPLGHWNEILLEILRSDVSDRAKKRIVTQGLSIAEVIADSTVTLMQGLDKKSLSTACALVLSGLHQQATKHAVLYIIRILCSLRDLLSDLSHRAYKIGTPIPPFPQMQEFLEWLWDDRIHVLRKKRWP